MTTEYIVNPMVWFAEREMPYPPGHFVAAPTPVTLESKQWVLDNLIGRFSISISSVHVYDFEIIGTISFEDPKEAMLFELKWS